MVKKMDGNVCLMKMGKKYEKYVSKKEYNAGVI